MPLQMSAADRSVLPAAHSPAKREQDNKWVIRMQQDKQVVDTELTKATQGVETLLVCSVALPLP